MLVGAQATYDLIEDMLKTISECFTSRRLHIGLVSLTRALLYNDPLIGLADKHIASIETHGYYQNATRALSRVQKDKGIFAPAFDTILRLSSLLEEKADFGLRLKAAYDRRDKAALAAMVAECRTVIRKVKKLRESHRASWMAYNTLYLASKIV